jgi:hypothetical protein
LGIQFADRAIQGRVNDRLGEVRLGGIQLGLGDADLFDGGGQSGFGHVVIVLGRQEIGFGNQLGLEEGATPFEFEVGPFQVGIGGVFVGRGKFEIGLGRIARRRIIIGPDLEQEVALLDMLPLLDVQLDDFA